MKINLIKAFAVVAIVFPLLLVMLFSTNPIGIAQTSQDDETAVLYKKKTCFACHKKDASKHFDAAKSDAELAEIILNGKKGEKPPNMPAYKSKGLTAAQATALVAHMRKLKGPAAAPTVQKPALDDEAAAALFKKKACFMCHKKDASKHFDAAKPAEDLIQTVLKGRKAEKPPNMPSYEKKGLTAEQAATLVAHMKKLREPAEPGH